eukprot:CAMPEP_0204057520 /NCGR_PEP_ID=MMETSP0360-20130528/134260_1 /ASSEMBLY_ACC=CAM_ASM_000342 /TAXON_ID=268821 /ORGANISM="Scrippsiella Hangoei, Strain SHTV-5" /LENGTH=182 /DNA_ID=CAMNT_0051004999 /DNA_START=1 /DNA_END=545 /DNA_ORIENTATION=-
MNGPQGHRLPGSPMATGNLSARDITLEGDAGCEGACFEAEGKTRTVKWAYVGEGQGGYSKVQSYNFVGPGVGSYDQDVASASYGIRGRIFYVGLMVMLAVAFCVYFLNPESALMKQQQSVETSEPEHASVTVELFNCYKESLMIPAKIQYCCQKHGLFCVSSTVAPPTAAPTTAPTPTPTST